MELYDMMFRRRSVRRYLPEALDAETLSSIEAYIAAVPQLPGQQAKFRIISSAEMGLSQAPHYIVASCDQTNEAYANVGFVLEKVDLYLQSIGLGSLWYGMRLPEKGQEGDAIVMQFGKTAVPMREEGDSFDRLPPAKIADADNAVTRAMRLAPSAVNSQPWQIHYTESALEIRYKGRGLMRAALEKKLNKIDIGIVSRFALLALEHEGKKVEKLTAKTQGRDFTVRMEY